MIQKLKDRIKCLLGNHSTEYMFALPKDNRKVFVCRRCGATFTVNGLTHKQERVRIVWKDAV